MARYAGNFPIAVGADVLGDRWNPLILREIMVGASGFNEIHRGIPRVSRTLLSQRLVRRPAAPGRAATGAGGGVRVRRETTPGAAPATGSAASRRERRG